jgi:hypothetical protein
MKKSQNKLGNIQPYYTYTSKALCQRYVRVDQTWEELRRRFRATYDEDSPSTDRSQCRPSLRYNQAD